MHIYVNYSHMYIDKICFLQNITYKYINYLAWDKNIKNAF